MKEVRFLKAHELLMLGLIDLPGSYRKRGAGVMGAEKLFIVKIDISGKWGAESYKLNVTKKFISIESCHFLFFATETQRIQRRPASLGQPS